MKTKRPTSLIGKAGLHLACFHLARLGHDFTITTDNSLSGDIWADFGLGIEAVEVKTMTRGAWQLRAAQTAKVARFMFVDADDGCCWLIAAPIVLAHMNAKTKASITVKQLERLKADPLHKRVGRVIPCPQVTRGTQRVSEPGQPGNRKVRRVLKDGTVRVYEYPRWQPPRYNFSTNANGTP